MTHPITVPPELVKQWFGNYYDCPVSGEISGVEAAIATRAAQWGADQELKACCHWLKDVDEVADELRFARRPKPPSLKEQALDVLHLSFDRGYLKEEAADTIRRALESIDD